MAAPTILPAQAQPPKLQPPEPELKVDSSSAHRAWW
jgi:hypothetical protein